MLQNPILQTVLLALGSYFSLAFVRQLGGEYGASIVGVLGLLGGFFTLVVWMLRYQRERLAGWCQGNAVVASVVDLVAKAAKEQVPVSGGPQGEAAAEADQPQAGDGKEGAAPDAPTVTGGSKGLLLVTEDDFRRAQDELKCRVLGQDENIEMLMTALQRNANLRRCRTDMGDDPPLGRFLMLGDSGLGKAYLASCVGQLLYPKGSALRLDLANASQADKGARTVGRNVQLKKLVDVVRGNPFQVIINDNADQASPAYVRALKEIFKTGRLDDEQTGRSISFKHCVFFLIVHKPMARLQESLAGSMSLAVPNLSQATSLDKTLVYSLDDCYLCFDLPESRERLAEIVAAMMKGHCRKFGKELERVAPEVLAREVRAVERLGGFECTPARIEKVLQAPLENAIQANELAVSL